LLCLASHTSIEYMYGFYDWSLYDEPSGLDDFSNSADTFALQHLPFLRKASSVIRSVKDCKLQLANRSNATWCLIMVRNEYLWKQGLYPPGTSPANYARIWPILGAMQTCIEHGVPHTIVHDATFMAANYDNAPILVVTMPASELPIEVQQQISLFTGKVIFMEAEYVASPPRLEKNFHNTTIDAPTGKTRAQISRDKLWDLMTSGGIPISVQTSIEIPDFLPEKPSPLASYEIGEDIFGNPALNIIMMADASWHDVRKHAFYIDWNNGPDVSVDGLCGRQNLLYTQPITSGGSTPVKVESGGFRRILDGCPCPDGFNRDCYFVEYTNSGIIPPQFLPAKGKLTFYAGYPPVWGNKRNASVTFNAKQKPYRVRQLLLNHDKGYFDPVDIYVDSDQFDLISFEQGSYAQIQFKQPNLMLPHMGICVSKTSMNIQNVDDYIAFLENISSSLPFTADIFVFMRCNGITKSKGFNANQLLTQMATDAAFNPGDYAWIQENPSSLSTPSDYWPIGFMEADVSQCGLGEVSISGIIFQKEGICTIAKRIPLLTIDANEFNTPTCACAIDPILNRVDRVPSVQDSLGSETWEPLIEAPLFKKTQFADGSFLVIKPISDSTSPFFNVDANGLLRVTGILAYLRSINNNIVTFTQNQKTIADLYSGIILDFPNAFDISQNAIHPTYCSLPNDVDVSQANGYMEGRRDIADVNGTFIKAMSKIRLEFPGTKVSIRGMGNFGDGSVIQEGKDDPTTSSILDPTFDARKGLQRRISESYGPLLEACDFIPIETDDGTAASVATNNTSIAYVRNHFVERNSASSSMYRSAERKPIFAASLLPTDHTVWSGTGFSPPSIIQGPTGIITYNNVNLYTYVKPMVLLQDCVGDGGFENSSANSFVTGASGCPGRFPGIASTLMEIPEGMRTIFMVRYNEGNMFDPNTTQFEPDVFADGSSSPFAVNETQFLYEDFSVVANGLKNLGAIPDYLTMNCEQDGHFSSYAMGGTLTFAQVQNIYNSPLFQQPWFSMPAPAYVFDYNGKYSNNINDLAITGNFHPQNNRAYLYWDQTMRAMHAQMLEQSIVKVTKEVWNVENVSNYNSYHVREWDPFYDINGHPFPRSSIIGNAQSVELYASFTASGAYKILDSDPTMIVRTNADGYGSGQVIDATVVDSWFQMLILIHKIRSIHRAAPNIPIRPFINSRHSSGDGGAPNPKWNIDSYGFGLYNESIRHFCLTGVDMITYWNNRDNTEVRLQQSVTNLNNVLSDINTRLGGWTLQTLVTNRVDFKAKYIISGAVTADGNYLWRVTPKPGITLVDDNANVVTVDADGGAWITSSSSDVPILYEYHPALTYNVWATWWDRSDAPADTDLIYQHQGLVEVLRFGELKTIRTPNSTASISEVEYQRYLAMCSRVPKGRRVMYDYYWQNPHYFKTYDDYYKLTSDGTTYTGNVSGFGDASPLRFQTPWSNVSTSHTKTSFKTFLNRCKTDNVMFDYFWDDTEGWTVFGLGGTNNAYSGSFNGNGIPVDYENWQLTPDPRMTPSIVADVRFNTVFNKNGRTFAQEVQKIFRELIGNQSDTRTAEQILSYFTNVTTRQNFKIPFGQGIDVLLAYYAFNYALLVQNFGTTRKNCIHDSFAETGFPVKKIFQSEVYPMSAEETKFVLDLNGHYIPVDNFSNYGVSPHFYGQTNLFGSRGYHTNPTTDLERYRFSFFGANVSAFSNVAHMAFIQDVQKARGIMRTTPSAYQYFYPIVTTPSNTFNASRYNQDPRYWYELMYHLCVHGAKFFHIFTEVHTAQEMDAVQTVLDEWKTISDNNHAIPVSNSTGSISTILERIELKDAAQNCLISGGYIPSLNKWIWRLTANPSNSSFTRNDPSQVDLPTTITIPGGSRGVWIERTVPGKPNYIPSP
jgi:hypothetical protein